MQPNLDRITPENETLVGLTFTSFETGRSYRVLGAFRYTEDPYDIELVEVVDLNSGEVTVLDPDNIRKALDDPPHF